MISIGYVNNTLTPMTDMLFREYSDEINDIYDNTDSICYEMSLLEERVNIEQEITGSVDETLMLEYEEKKKNFFQKIGETVIAIFEKIRAAIQSAIDKIKEIAFGSKSDLQKLDTLIKKHPELKNEAICAFNSGALDMKDIKSLKELDAAFEEIIRMSKEKDIDPNTLKGKWEKAKKKFQEDEKTWKIVKVGAAATTVITAIKAIATFNGILRKNRDELQESNAKNKELEAEIEKTLTAGGFLYKKDKDGNTIKDKNGSEVRVGYHTAMLQILRERNGFHDAARMKNLTLIEHMQNGIAKFLDKFTPKSKTDRLYSDYSTERLIKGEKEKDETDKNNKRVESETSARLTATLKHRKNNKSDYDKVATDEAYAKASGTLQHKLDNSLDYQQAANDDAYGRAEGTLNHKEINPTRYATAPKGKP